MSLKINQNKSTNPGHRGARGQEPSLPTLNTVPVPYFLPRGRAQPCSDAKPQPTRGACTARGRHRQVQSRWGAGGRHGKGGSPAGREARCPRSRHWRPWSPLGMPGGDSAQAPSSLLGLPAIRGLPRPIVQTLGPHSRAQHSHCPTEKGSRSQPKVKPRVPPPGLTHARGPERAALRPLSAVLGGHRTRTHLVGSPPDSERTCPQLLPPGLPQPTGRGCCPCGRTRLLPSGSLIGRWGGFSRTPNPVHSLPLAK